MPAVRSKFEMYLPGDKERLFDNSLEEFNILNCDIYGSPFYRDYGQLIHSPAFRRLQGKSSFLSDGSTSFRNRWTHAMEVAQIAKAIANRLNCLLSDKPKRRRDIVNYIDTDLVQFAGLAHELGYPPFGQSGELELNAMMKDHGGFESHAQTLRTLSKIERHVKWDPSNKNQDPVDGFSKTGAHERHGLNVTARSLAAVLTYDVKIEVQKSRYPTLTRGYYSSERALVNEVKKRVTRGQPVVEFKTAEMQILEIADDIAYSVYELEDSLKAGIGTDLDAITDLYDTVSIAVSTQLGRKIKQEEVRKIVKAFVNKVNVSDAPEILTENIKSGEQPSMVTPFAFTNSRPQARNGYYRSEGASLLVDKFIRSVHMELLPDNPAFSRIYIDNDCKIFNSLEKQAVLTIEVLKQFTYAYQLQLHKQRQNESKRRDMLSTIFNKILRSKGALMPEDHGNLYTRISKHPNEEERVHLQYRTICDFVASMTDQYAVEFHRMITADIVVNI